MDHLFFGILLGYSEFLHLGETRFLVFVVLDLRFDMGEKPGFLFNSISNAQFPNAPI
jgi:hypothetical protein